MTIFNLANKYLKCRHLIVLHERDFMSTSEMTWKCWKRKTEKNFAAAHAYSTLQMKLQSNAGTLLLFFCLTFLCLTGGRLLNTFSLLFHYRKIKQQKENLLTCFWSYFFSLPITLYSMYRYIVITKERGI